MAPMHGQAPQSTRCAPRVPQREMSLSLLVTCRLRRVLRRAVWFGQTFLGAPKGFFHTLVPTVVGILSGPFPELAAKQEHVMSVLAQYEEAGERFIVPAWPIGLQAARITFAGRDVRARAPWWRRK